LSAFTVKNLREDVEDMAPKFGMAPQMEARFARGDLECEKTGLSFQRLAATERAAFGHRHGEQEEIYVVVGGGGRMKAGDEVVDLRTWDAVRVAPETIRAFEAGPDGLELLAFGAPTTDNRDAELLHGWWSE
jgi:mannose-6-phosphate isomerase-like protein (cupin superfamily)